MVFDPFSCPAAHHTLTVIKSSAKYEFLEARSLGISGHPFVVLVGGRFRLAPRAYWTKGRAALEQLGSSEPPDMDPCTLDQFLDHLLHTKRAAKEVPDIEMSKDLEPEPKTVKAPADHTDAPSSAVQGATDLETHEDASHDPKEAAGPRILEPEPKTPTSAAEGPIDSETPQAPREAPKSDEVDKSTPMSRKQRRRVARRNIKRANRCP